ncbi:MAG: cytochrome c3 family protein [Planctomycetota bacterium]|nr:cytochrome c3 family protein [Planctomycetota bacterium]
MAPPVHAFALVALLSSMRIAFGGDPDVNAHPDMQSPSITGCMTTACHGSNVPDAKNWQRAGKIWFDTDPHARAYTSLLTDTSAKIVSRLVNKELKRTTPISDEYRQVLDAKCISCHSNENVSESQRVLGADCQVCHGSADAWGSEHYSSEWKSLGKNRFEGTQRINVESIAGRAKVCASCHVGELDRKMGQNKGLDREVDHRLMAAGHPPMYFEFESFLRRYPIHWDTQDESIELGSKLGMERWRVGKITTAIAKLKLLAARAERSASKSAQTADWPELTEYSCTDCHHSLVQPSWRSTSGSNKSTIANWDDWTVSQLDCAVRNQSMDELNSQLTRLKKSVEHTMPEPTQVASIATSLKEWLEMELNHVSSPSENSAEVMVLKLKSRMAGVDSLQNWESATQWYLATRVLSEGIGILGSKAPVSFVKEDPFVNTGTWLPKASNEFDSPRNFAPNMLNDYSTDLKRQLQTRP